MSKPFLIPTAVVALIVAGCHQQFDSPSRVEVPQSPNDGGTVKTYPHLRPLRPQEQGERLPPPAFEDAPLVTQAPPEQPEYLEAYARVGKPRLAVFVNRTIEGQIIPVDEQKTVVGATRTRESNGTVDIGSGRNHFKSDGPARVSEKEEVYLSPGQYDDAQAKAIDYEAIELALADALAANGRVSLESPTMARQRLTDAEVKDLQSGRPQVLREVAEKLDTDILIQVQARPTKQTADGLGVRVLVEAIDTHNGESIARSFVDVPPPLEKTTINKYTRFLARKTMYELTGTWDAMASEPPHEPTSRP